VGGGAVEVEEEVGESIFVGSSSSRLKLDVQFPYNLVVAKGLLPHRIGRPQGIQVHRDDHQ
jgi:hypothetical protein